MPLPDQSHMNQVRNALWHPSGSRASVMVGAGFSRNGKKIGPGVSEFPLWHDTAKELCYHLYSEEDQHRRESALAEASGTSGFLRLAQEYESAFGRGALHELIRKAVPDENYLPSDFHKDLLKLPWKDVFTTNWDTLLERTLLHVTNRNYRVVRTVDEIASSNGSRIFKLHGSFPSSVPFIFTEEDYRSYPKKNAPFVNTVQQSMMETVFLLVGFSGEDPNFLHWTGWVRDNLGDAAPKIYLAGWLDLSAHRRRMLENRNVVPIDLASHPKAKMWPEHLKHQYATEWLLKTLECGQPYNFMNWPQVPERKTKKIPEYLQPVDGLTGEIPQDESKYPVGYGEEKITVEGLRKHFDSCKFNRKMYPGWLILPPDNSHFILRTLEYWEKAFFDNKELLTYEEIIFYLDEFVFRSSLVLNPIPNKVVNEIRDVLFNVDCHARKINGKFENVDWGELYLCCFRLTKSLVTSYRFDGNETDFNFYMLRLNNFLGCEEEATQFVSHEKCLWLLNDFKLEALDSALDKWDVAGVDPIWMARKAAILVEAGRSEDGIRTLEHALEEIRKSERGDSLISSSSRESWMLWMAQAIEWRYKIDEEFDYNDESAFDRWKELSHLACDVSSHKEFYIKELLDNRESKEAQPFDLGVVRGKTINFSERKFIKWRAALRVLRLTEVAGLPAKVNNVRVSLDDLKIASEILLENDPLFAMKLMLRITDFEGDNSFNIIWSRPVIASIELVDVIFLVEVVGEFIDFSSTKVSANSKNKFYWIGRLRVAIEALSRLVLRLDKDGAEKIFDKAIAIYSSDLIFAHTWLSKPIENLLSRSWEAIPKRTQDLRSLDVMKLPILGVNDKASEVSDPVKVLANRNKFSVAGRNNDNNDSWLLFLQIIKKGLLSISFERENACLRLAVSGVCNHLNDEEKLQFANAIWGNVNRKSNLPQDTGLNNWVFFLLPQVEPETAYKRYKKNIFKDPLPKRELLSDLGLDLNTLHMEGVFIDLDADEQSKLFDCAMDWTKTFYIKEVEDPFSRENYIKEEVCVGLGYLLIFFDFPRKVVDAVYKKVMSEDNAAFCFLYPGLSKYYASNANAISHRIRIFLSSEDEESADKVLEMLNVWLKYSRDSSFHLPDIPDDIVKEIGIIVATRRKKGLNRSLQFFRKVFSKGEDSQKALVYEMILHGLSYLIEELDYSRSHNADTDSIPLWRWGCAHLALAMAEGGFGYDPIVKKWVSVAENDPLPEVRNAASPLCQPSCPVGDIA
ncbi:SIR2 family NAD-dependent protein deacylase [Vreelandella olivaria]|uniref:SIR2 family NAD-dependent protein deacylase n=1 Tax=Vreelandella olivaria TaxID=390919 RepID=UPI00201ED34F|nr:SIR2 family protein [Halomonas olivaria]